MDNSKSYNVYMAILKTIALVGLLLVAYLFALNGRYHYDGSTVVDKWTNKVGYLGDFDIEW